MNVDLASDAVICLKTFCCIVNGKVNTLVQGPGEKLLTDHYITCFLAFSRLCIFSSEYQHHEGTSIPERSNDWRNSPVTENDPRKQNIHIKISQHNSVIYIPKRH